MDKDNIISRFDEFETKFKDLPYEKNATRVTALKQYFSSGGVISTVPKKNGWPGLTYPNPLRLKKKIDELEAKKKVLLEKKQDWQKKWKSAESYHRMHNRKKLSNSLYWKHFFKTMTNSEYRNDVNKVKLPVHLVSDKRWEPMIRMFITDYDYRKQLADTVENSVVYKNDRRVAKFADTLKEFRMTASEKKLTELDEKIKKIENEIFVLNEIMVWAKKS